MNKLIINELFKIFKRKTIYVFMALILAFCLLNNILYKTTYDEEGNYIYNYNTYEEVDYDKLKELDYNNENEVDEYIYIKNMYDIQNIVKENNFKEDSNQYSLVYEFIYDIIDNVNTYTYKDNNQELVDYYTDILNEYLDKIKENDWKYFIDITIKDLEKTNEELNDNLDSATSLMVKDIKRQIDENTIKLEVLKLRLDNDIDYSNNYLSNAVINYQDDLITLSNYESNTYEEKQEYQNILSDKEINKYIITNKYNINKENTLRVGIKDLISDYEIFIMLFIIIISSSIVSSEFKNGTIKQLLTKPYTRTSILLSKYLTCILCFIFIVAYTLIIEFIIGSLFFGIDSLKIPVLIYNYNTSALLEYNAFIYMLIMLVHKLPIFILLFTLAFSLSCIFNSTSLANTLTILGYIFSNTISLMYFAFNLKILKYFVTLNWDLTEYIYGKLPSVEGLTMYKSILICLCYYLIMIIVSFTIFNKRNVKNI